MNLVRTWLKIFATASVVLGPTFGVLAIGFAVYTTNFIHHASHTNGTVIALTEVDQDNTVTYIPTFSFKTPSARSITKKSDTGTNPSFSVGDQVPVLFDPKYPQNAKIATTAQLWFLPIVFGIISVLFTPVGIFLLRRPQIATTPFTLDK